METLTDRLTRYLLARLRHRAVLDLYEAAAHVGLLESDPAYESGERGAVWTIAENAQHLMRGDKDKDRKLIARRLGSSRTSSGGTTLTMFDYETNQDAELEVRPRTKSRVNHMAASAGKDETRLEKPATRIAGRSFAARTENVLAMVRQHVPAPSVAHVAVVLLVARAVGSSIPGIVALNSLMSHPDLFALIKAPVPRFERRFTQMLEDGLLLPYRVNVGDVYHGATLREQYHGERKTKSRRPVRLLSGRRTRHIEHAVLSQHLGDAFLDRSAPVIVVDETSVAPPPSLAMTADVVFECAGLDHSLLAELLHITLGIAPTLSLKRMKALALDLEGLSIDDLTLAIRPSHDLETILATLAALGGRARSRDEDDDNKDSDDDHRRTSRGLTSKTRKMTSGETAKAEGSLDSVEIIQPLKPVSANTVGKTVTEASVPTERLVGHSPPLRIETLSGYGEAKQWALDLKTDLELWRDGRLCWSDISTKLLLSGPPGTGKTSYARGLCNTLQVSLLVTSIATWLEPGYLGDVLKRMSQAFEAARAHAPCILFIDEIDNIGSRSSGRREQYDDYWRSLINRLLELVDGTSKTDGVVIVAATNLPDRIDPALLRSGRLENHVVIPMPDTEALSGILAHHLANDLTAVLSSAPPQTSVHRPLAQKARDDDLQRHRETAATRRSDNKEGAPQ